MKGCSPPASPPPDAPLPRSCSLMNATDHSKSAPKIPFASPSRVCVALSTSRWTVNDSTCARIESTGQLEL